jgi:hypothetical protein
MLEYDGLKENGAPNIGVYCGIWGGGSGVAEIGGGLWYCRTLLAGFGELSVLPNIIEQIYYEIRVSTMADAQRRVETVEEKNGKKFRHPNFT